MKYGKSMCGLSILWIFTVFVIDAVCVTGETERKKKKSTELPRRWRRAFYSFLFCVNCALTSVRWCVNFAENISCDDRLSYSICNDTLSFEMKEEKKTEWNVPSISLYSNSWLLNGCFPSLFNHFEHSCIQAHSRIQFFFLFFLFTHMYIVSWATSISDRIVSSIRVRFFFSFRANNKRKKEKENKKKKTKKTFTSLM